MNKNKGLKSVSSVPHDMTRTCVATVMASSRNTYAHLTGHTVEVIKGLEVGADNDGRVDVALQESLYGCEHLAGQDDDRSGAVADLLILRS